MNPGHHGRLVIAGVLACAVLLLGTGNLAGTPIGSGSHHPPLPAPVAGIVGSIASPSSSAAAPPDMGLWGGAPFPYRESASVAFDPSDHYVVVFGGWTTTRTTGVTFDQTWTYRAGDWTLLNSPQHPSARYGAAMVYDAADRYVLLYGGSTLSCNPSVKGGCGNDTWSFQSGSWSRILTSTAPPVTTGMAMVYDAGDGYVLLFGGAGAHVGQSGATWTYHAGVWTNISGSVGTAPSPRQAAAATYSTAGHDVVLFGGAASGTNLGDTWEFANGSWTNLTPSLGKSPSGRGAATMAYDPSTRVVMMVGGYLTTGSSVVGVWSFANGHWTNYTKIEPTPANSVGELVWDGQDHSMFFLGGYAFSYSSGTWTRIDATTPVLGWGAAVAPDPKDGYVLQFGGVNLYNGNGNPGGPSNATWSYQGGRWTNLTPGLKVSPLARNGAAMAYDPNSNAVILFAGETYSAGGLGGRALNDTWSFSAGVWTNITRHGPTPPSGGSLTWDARDGYLLLYNPAPPTDTWEFAGGVWTNLTTSIHPTSGSSNCGYVPALAYDYSDGYVVLFGCLVSVTWTFTGGLWTNITHHGGPNPGYLGRDMTLGFDFGTDRLILSGEDYMGTWVFHHGNWTWLDPDKVDGSGSPGDNSSVYDWGSAVWDARDGYLLVLGVYGEFTWSIR